ncbi:hypothetical protein D3C86_1833940 [compost metagenome]
MVATVRFVARSMTEIEPFFRFEIHISLPTSPSPKASSSVGIVSTSSSLAVSITEILCACMFATYKKRSSGETVRFTGMAPTGLL